MTTRISPRDWEALSAYLDGQLSPKERVRLEKRLRLSTDLRSAMEDLRRTRAVLRSQPRLRAPRNFTLTPDMVAPALRRGSTGWKVSALFPTLSMASALAGVLFIVILFADLLNIGPAAAPVVVEQAGGITTQEVSLMVERQAAPEAPAAEPQETGQAAALQDTAPSNEAPTAQTEALQAAPTQPAASTAVAGGAAPSLPYPGPTAALATPAEASPLTRKALAPTPYPPPVERVPAQPGAEAAPERERLSGPGFWTEWRVLEVALGVIALGTGLAAYLVRRSGSQ